jgi:hypothetical protein
MRPNDTNEDASVIALNALGWTLSEPDRAQRLLDVTGLDPEDLRVRATEPAVLSAVLDFLESHEPDLLACAEEVGVRPEALVAARAQLDGGEVWA